VTVTDSDSESESQVYTMFTNSLHQVCTSQYLGLCQVYTRFKLHLHWHLVYTPSQSIFRINLQPESLLLTKTAAGAALAAGDPFPPIIRALNSYLHAYHMYRAEAPCSF
jgi:hypothetical protein